MCANDNSTGLHCQSSNDHLNPTLNHNHKTLNLNLNHKIETRPFFALFSVKKKKIKKD